MTTLDDTITIDLPKELVERIANYMETPDNDSDFWQIYCACLKAIYGTVDA